VDCRVSLIVVVVSSSFIRFRLLRVVSVGCSSVFLLSVPTSAYTLQGSRNRAKTTETEFVNLLRRPGIDSLPGGPVR
jgi:hypothetical protein